MCTSDHEKQPLNLRVSLLRDDAELTEMFIRFLFIIRIILHTNVADQAKSNYSNGALSSRHTSNSSYSSTSSHAYSVGPGNRPPSRSHISHNRARSTTRTGRPATSMGTREEGQRNNGTVTPNAHRTKKSTSSIPRKKNMRKYQSCQDIPYQQPLSQSREVSFSDRLAALSLNESRADEQKNQATCNLKKPPEVLLPQPNPIRDPASGRVCHQDSPIREQKSRSIVPTTPQHEASLQLVESLRRSIKNVKVHMVAMSPSPTKGPFLNRDSNNRGYIVSDIDEKLGQMDTEFQKVKEFMAMTEKDSAIAREELEMLKKRGRQRCPDSYYITY